MRTLRKTTVVIWSEADEDTMELEDLARDAVEGESYCSRQQSVIVEHPEQDPDWDGTDFFTDLLEREVDEEELG